MSINLRLTVAHVGPTVGGCRVEKMVYIGATYVDVSAGLRASKNGVLL